ncbi:MAG: copper amine oxidase N-terminal domain-containing protein [Bacillota bacterium]
MKKRFVTLCLIFVLFSSSAIYADDNITVIVNGKQVKTETPAVMVSGTTMLPFRSIFNALGVGNDSIKWTPGSKSIEVRSGDKYIFLAIGNSAALLNDSLITLNVAPYISNGSTLVPVRFVSEALGADVQWDKTTKTVTITK